MNPNRSIIRLFLARLTVYLAAVGLTYLLASASATQYVISRLATMGIVVGFAERLSMTLRDLLGMAGMFLPLIAFAMLAAFLVTALLQYWLRRWQTALYVTAGATAMLALHFGLHLALGLTPVPIAGSAGGLLIQALAGAAGGYLYIRLRRRLGPDEEAEHGAF